MNNNLFKKRIDELGRIVIPKQIRNTFKIKNFDELEMFVDKDSIILKKSIGLEMYKEKLERLLLFIKKYIDFDILIAEKQKIIVSTKLEIKSNDEIDVENIDGNINIKLKNNDMYNVSFLPIIIDSNNIGELYFINHDKKLDESLLKQIRGLIIDLIN